MWACRVPYEPSPGGKPLQGFFAGVLCAASPDPKIKHPINGDPTPLRTLLGVLLLVVIVCTYKYLVECFLQSAAYLSCGQII